MKAKCCFFFVFHFLQGGSVCCLLCFSPFYHLFCVCVVSLGWHINPQPA